MVQAGVKMLQGVLVVTDPVQIEEIGNPDLDVFPTVEYTESTSIQPMIEVPTHTAAAVFYDPTQDQQSNTAIGQVFDPPVVTSV